MLILRRAQLEHEVNQLDVQSDQPGLQDRVKGDGTAHGRPGWQLRRLAAASGAAAAGIT